LVSLTIQSNTLPRSDMQNIVKTEQGSLNRKEWACGRGNKCMEYKFRHLGISGSPPNSKRTGSLQTLEA
jgi:hypothetical protein